MWTFYLGVVKYLVDNFETSPSYLRTGGISQGTSPAYALALGLSAETMLETGLTWANLVYCVMVRTVYSV